VDGKLDIVVSLQGSNSLEPIALHGHASRIAFPSVETVITEMNAKGLRNCAPGMDIIL